LLWARQIESDGNEWVNGMATDARGHLYVTGNFDGSYLRLEDVVFEKSIYGEREDSYVAHYDPDGRLLWAEHIGGDGIERDRKSTRLNSSHVKSSYAVFCLKKKKKT